MISFLRFIRFNIIACLSLFAAGTMALSTDIAEIKITHAAKTDVKESDDIETMNKGSNLATYQNIAPSRPCPRPLRIEFKNA